MGTHFRKSRAARGLLKINSGAAGIAIGAAEPLWVLNRLKEVEDDNREEDLGVLAWATRRRHYEQKHTNITVFIDTDPRSEKIYARAKSWFAKLGIATKWVRLPGPTAAQNPEALYNRLESGDEAAKILTETFEEIARTIAINRLQAIAFDNSMHGSGDGTSIYIAGKILPKLLHGDYLRIMTAINADVSRVPSKLDYLKSTRWSLSKFNELLAKELLDAVIIIDNTVASAVKSVWAGLESKEKLKLAWYRLLKLEDPYEAAAAFYGIVARMAQLDPEEFNDLIVHAKAPLVIVPAWGLLIEGAERELRGSSAPWDYYNIKRVVKGGYVIPGYLPTDQVKKVDFKTIAAELALVTLAPLDPATVRNIIIVLGEKDRELWASKGISMYTAIENSFAEIGYDGPIDILTLTH